MKDKPKISFALVISVISTIIFSGCSIGNVDSDEGPLTLRIESPENSTILESNLIKVSGIVSHHEAKVLVTGTPAIVDITGSFFSYIELSKGLNEIRVEATLAGHKTSNDIEVTFDPPLVLIADPFHGEKGADYTVTPAEISGYVSDPAAEITVNEIPVSVKKDGTYSKSLLLKEGKNYLNVVATSGDKSDTIREEIIVMPDGELTIIPRLGEAILSGIPTIELKAGETKFADIQLQSGKRDFPRPTELRWYIQSVSELYGNEQVHTPEGLDVYIEPAVFTVYPGRIYSSTIVASAMSNIAPGQYYFKLSTVMNNGPVGWFSIMAENEY